MASLAELAHEILRYLHAVRGMEEQRNAFVDQYEAVFDRHHNVFRTQLVSHQYRSAEDFDITPEMEIEMEAPGALLEGNSMENGILGIQAAGELIHQCPPEAIESGQLRAFGDAFLAYAEHAIQPWPDEEPDDAWDEFAPEDPFPGFERYIGVMKNKFALMRGHFQKGLTLIDQAIDEAEKLTEPA